MPRGASELPDDRTEAAGNLRARALRARLLPDGMPDEQAANGLREYAAGLESQAAALEPAQEVPPDT
jgi:hypothetical protein